MRGRKLWLTLSAAMCIAAFGSHQASAQEPQKTKSKTEKTADKAVAKNEKTADKAAAKVEKTTGKATAKTEKTADKSVAKDKGATKTATGEKTSKKTVVSAKDATGKCKDGSYTRAASKQGACSGHGGVADWLKK